MSFVKLICEDLKTFERILKASIFTIVNCSSRKLTFFNFHIPNTALTPGEYVANGVIYIVSR